MDEVQRLKSALNAIEMMTATGDGLTPDECISVHLLAAEGRADDPHAWRLDETARQSLYRALSDIPDDLKDAPGGGYPVGD